jgi:hypothetical protein
VGKEFKTRHRVDVLPHHDLNGVQVYPTKRKKTGSEDFIYHLPLIGTEDVLITMSIFSPYLPFEQVKRTCKVLLDTGALRGNYISEDVACWLEGQGVQPNSCMSKVCGAIGDTCVSVTRSFVFMLEFYNECNLINETFKIEASVLKDSQIELIVGRPTIITHNLSDKIHSWLHSNTHDGIPVLSGKLIAHLNDVPESGKCVCMLNDRNHQQPLILNTPNCISPDNNLGKCVSVQSGFIEYNTSHRNNFDMVNLLSVLTDMTVIDTEESAPDIREVPMSLIELESLSTDVASLEPEVIQSTSDFLASMDVSTDHTLSTENVMKGDSNLPVGMSDSPSFNNAIKELCLEFQDETSLKHLRTYNLL